MEAGAVWRGAARRPLGPAGPAARIRELAPAGALLAAVTLLALALRLALVRSVWVDEAITIHQVHMSLPAMLHDLRATDNHPPLSYVIEWLAVRAFGYGEVAIHLPSIVEGTLLAPMLYLLGRELYGRRTGLTAAGLVAIAPLAVWYAQEARDYALFMLLITAAVWAQIRALRDGRARFWIAYAAATIALLYTHYFAVLPIAVQQAAFAAVVWRRARAGRPVRGLVLALWAVWLATLLALLPLAPFAVAQIRHDQASGVGFADGPTAVGQLTGSSLSVYAVLSNVLWAIWGYHSDGTMLRLAALWPLVMLMTLALLGRGRRAQTMFVLALAFAPMLVLVAVGLTKRNLFDVRYFAAAVPMGALLCARGVCGISRARGPVVVATAALALSLLVALADEQLNPANPRAYDFRDAIARVSSRARPGDRLLFAPDYVKDVLAYYRPHLSSAVLAGGRPSVPARTGGVFLLASFLNDPRTAAQIGSARYVLAREYRTRRLLFARSQVEVYEYR
jgi:hypothetical protein